MGRPLALGDLDQELQKYIKALRASSRAISAPLVMAAAAQGSPAQGSVEAKNSTPLVEHGGSLNNWVNSSMWRMRFVRQAATTH